MLKNLADVLYLAWINFCLVLGIIFILPAMAILPLLDKWRKPNAEKEFQL